MINKESSINGFKNWVAFRGKIVRLFLTIQFAPVLVGSKFKKEN